MDMSQIGTEGITDTITFTTLMRIGANYIETTQDQHGKILSRRLLGPDLKLIRQLQTPQTAPERKSPSD